MMEFIFLLRGDIYVELNLPLNATKQEVLGNFAEKMSLSSIKSPLLHQTASQDHSECQILGLSFIRLFDLGRKLNQCQTISTTNQIT